MLLAAESAARQIGPASQEPLRVGADINHGHSGTRLKASNQLEEERGRRLRLGREQVAPVGVPTEDSVSGHAPEIKAAFRIATV